MTRRLIFIVLLILLQILSTVATLSVLVTFQVAYIVALLIIRPFQELKVAIIEMVNECFFLGLACGLFHFRTKEAWNTKAVDAYIGLLLTNNIVVFLILLGNLRSGLLYLQDVDRLIIIVHVHVWVKIESWHFLDSKRKALFSSDSGNVKMGLDYKLDLHYHQHVLLDKQ